MLGGAKRGPLVDGNALAAAFADDDEMSSDEEEDPPNEYRLLVDLYDWYEDEDLLDQIHDLGE